MANTTFFNSLIRKGGLTKLSRKSLIDIGITTVLVDGCLISGVTLASLLVTGGISEPLVIVCWISFGSQCHERGICV